LHSFQSGLLYHMSKPATYKLTCRNEGHASQYFTLRIEREGREPEVRTSKQESYLLQFIPAGAVRVY
jgi:hypothetical protein